MTASARLIRAAFAAALFLNAALLFLVEPMTAKILLPAVGGAAAVWTTSLVFFQAALLTGYVYAAWVSRRLSPGWQWRLHGTLLVGAMAVLPFGAGALGPPPVSSNPTLWVFASLALLISPAFVMLAATTPLIQAWFARAAGARSDAYALYAASNAGSLAGLLAYPLAIERLLALDGQRQLWMACYAVNAVAILACGLLALRLTPRAMAADAGTARAARGTRSDRWRWAALAFWPAGLTISVTTFISTDVAAIPLLWAAPLSLYLVTFVIAFSRPFGDRWLRVASTVAVLPPLVGFVANLGRPIWLQMPIHLVAFFLVALVAHQALARARPPHERLTDYYIWLAAGGAAGGLFAAILAPLLFPTTLEYPIGLIAALWIGTSSGRSPRLSRSDLAVPALAAGVVIATAFLTARAGWGAGALGTLAVVFGPGFVVAALVWPRPRRFALTLAAVVAAGAGLDQLGAQTLRTSRSFFGIHRVIADDTRRFHVIMDGSTIHGVQRFEPAADRECLAYYSRTGPAGQAFARLASGRRPQRVGILGLGAGTLACYAEPGQAWTFFEIDPAVVSLATTRTLFTYLPDAPAAVRLVLGDARRSLSQMPPQQYDVLVLDTFSSDAIPVHLLTREALRLYVRHLAAGGLLLVHVSNLYFDLRPVVGLLARDAGLAALAERDEGSEAAVARGVFPSDWVAIARVSADLAELSADPRWTSIASSSARVWTDAFSNPVAAIRWRK